MHVINKKGFTLIELLVVIAIIAILAGLLLPAVNGVRKQGYITRAKTEVKSLESAIMQYFTEYGKYPLKNGTPDTGSTVGKFTGYGSTDNKELIGILRAIDGPGNVSHEKNPRRIVFLELQKKSLDSKGNMIDPWDRQYVAAMDTDFNGSVLFASQSTLNIDPKDTEARKVAVFSLGPNGKVGVENDYIKSWE